MQPPEVRLPPDSAPGDISGSPRAHILIAEPDEDRRLACTAVLQNAGYRVTAVADGSATLAEAASGLPDLIILPADLDPGGLALCRELRSSAETRMTPVMVLTKRDDPFVREQVVRAGGSAILTTPLKNTRLLHRVRRLLARSRPRSL
jgi:DNA-binding response OmpR family regulator